MYRATILSSCLACRRETIGALLDFGMQPVCNRFLSPTANEEYLHPLSLGQCSACGVVQIIEPAPASALSPQYDWIVYNEPEDHLSQLADAISCLPEITKVSAICGVSFFDKPLLKILAERGFETRRGCGHLNQEQARGFRYSHSQLYSRTRS